MIFSEKACIGRGGQGAVYRIWDLELGRNVAVKVVKGNALQEAVFLSRLKHRALPVVIQAYCENGNTYIFMEYIEGKTLTEVIEKRGGISQEQAVSWGLEILDVLQYLHGFRPSLVYGDLKTDNLMIQNDGRIRLIDFGAVKETRDHQTKSASVCYLTRGFAAPELYNSELNCSPDIRSDIYSFGAVLFYMLTAKDPSRPPYHIKQIRSHDPGLSDKLNHLIDRCTRTQPANRYQSCVECARDLNCFRQTDQKVNLIKNICKSVYHMMLLISCILSLIGMEHINKGSAMNGLSLLVAGGLVCLVCSLIRMRLLENKNSQLPVRTTVSLFLTEKKTQY
ncbi:MAG: serine/threonine-protein kinase [Lachnospiraceae bacterium]|nr:serine/threonine-protein kinase [Lachnospiraceae bacterium]MDD3660154.1 serine/threonine-protein kinase [Lachnospiraceae bacterium]